MLDLLACKIPITIHLKISSENSMKKWDRVQRQIHVDLPEIAIVPHVLNTGTTD